VQASNIEREVERRSQVRERGHVGDQETCPCLGRVTSRASSSGRDRGRREIDPDGMPAVTREVHDVGAGPAAKVQCTSGRWPLVLDERDELRWDDAGVPAWTAKAVAKIEDQASYHVAPVRSSERLTAGSIGTHVLEAAVAQFNDKVTPKDFVKMAPEYKDLLIRLLTIQADCEIGGPHIYVDHWTLRAPTVDDQWRVARIASEEIDHCRKMLRLLNLIDVDRSDILERPRSKREVDAFKEDMPTWADFAAFGFLIDKVGQYQLEEMVGSTFAPIDDTLPVILREEKGHVAYGEQQLEKLVRSGDDGKAQAQAAIDKWFVVGLDMFGKSGSSRTERYLEWGLKRRTNEEARRQYIAEMEPKIAALGLIVPDRLQGRKYL